MEFVRPGGVYSWIVSPTKRISTPFLPSKHPTDLCPLCETEPETLRHFVLDCPLKATFWIYALPMINAPPSTTLDIVWDAIHLRFSSPLDFCAQNLPAIGLVLQTIWAMHWRCVLEGSTWNLTVANNHLMELKTRYNFLVPELNT
ncbi:hypothetical protein BJV82DRAFT_676069 [Fennellomyces sp. T-0311]|nr:hypothetical protein BJV82DRAFT_676069 [Fennellomyces sp. T-0311]